jgi:hypothetical protein
VKAIVVFACASAFSGTMSFAHTPATFSQRVIGIVEKGDSAGLEKLATAGIVTGNPYDSSPQTASGKELLNSLKGCTPVVVKETHYIKDQDPDTFIGPTTDITWRCSEPPKNLSSAPLPLDEVYPTNKEYCFDDVVSMDIYLRTNGHIIYARKSKLMNPQRCDSGPPKPLKLGDGM